MKCEYVTKQKELFAFEELEHGDVFRFHGAPPKMKLNINGFWYVLDFETNVIKSVNEKEYMGLDIWKLDSKLMVWEV
jgi:hypothetical protein